MSLQVSVVSILGMCLPNPVTRKAFKAQLPFWWWWLGCGLADFQTMRSLFISRWEGHRGIHS